MMLSEVSVKRPVFATVMSLLLIAFGLLSFTQLQVRELPDVDPPLVSVSTVYPGANSAIVETRVTQIIEGAIAGISGIKTIQSTSVDGRSGITIEFDLDRDIDAAANDVRDRISRVLENLPEEVDPPVVAKADDDTRPIIWFSFLGEGMDTRQLTDYAERNIVDRLSVVDGVSSVFLGGQSRYAIRIDLDRQAMAARGVTVQDVEAVLRAENVELPAGKVESLQRDTIVRTTREYARAEDFNDLVLQENEDGAFVRLSDVANIELGGERDRGIFHANGKSVLGLGIIKQSKANSLEVSKAARAEIERIKRTLPDHMYLDVNYDSSLFIEDAINEVYVTLGIAMGLVVLVLYLFLGNIKTVIVPVITVPVCIIASFWIMASADVSINLITLLGIVLAIGLVVDDAIVVLENIYRRVEEGERGLLAAYRGSKQVGFAVLATTAVLIGVFVPIMFLTGNIGRLFGELAITMSAAVIFSSLVALSLTPMLCSILVRRSNKKPAFARMLDRAFDRLQEAYGRTLDVAIDNKGMMTLLFLLCFVMIAGLMPRIPEELAPIEDRGFLIMSVRGPEGASINYLETQVERIEDQVLPLVEKGDVKRFIIRVNTTGGFGFIILNPYGERRPATTIANEMRRNLSTNAPGIRAFPFQTSGLSRRGGGGGQALQFVIGGDTYEDLARYKDIVVEELRSYPGIANMDVDFKETQPQFIVKIDRDRAADLGVSISQIGLTLETMMAGRQVTTFVLDGEEYDVIVQAAPEDRQQPLDMENIYVSSRSGTLVPLNNLLAVNEASGVSALNRFNRVRALTISGDIAPGYTLGEVVTHLEEMVRTAIPDATNTDYKGATREFKEAGSDIYFIFALALVVVFLVMAAQFESWLHPFVIMLTVPLAVMGGLLGLYMTGSTLNIYSQLGLIMLIGLAAKNGILIVEFANQLRDEGLRERDALKQAAKTRLRPILMTGLSTAIGALPLILAEGAGSAARFTIGVVVFGGVIVATVLTLFIVPTFYDLLAKYTKSPEHVARQLKSQAEEAGIGLEAPAE